MEFIIVLGNSKKEIWQPRVDAAVQHFFSKPRQIYCEYTHETINTCRIILTGKGKTKTEAQQMKNYILEKYSISNELLIIEDQSLNTLENLQYSKKIIDQISYFTKPTITICTSTFHIYRSMTLAKFIFDQYPQSYIHTDEKCNKSQLEQEMNYLYNFLHSKI